jgi:WD40 repeat protein
MKVSGLHLPAPWLLALFVLGTELGAAAVAQEKPKVEIVPQKGHSNAVTSVAFSADSRWLLTGSNDQTLRLWDAATGTLIRTFTGHLSKVNAIAFVFENNRALSGGADKVLRLWDLSTGQLLSTFDGHREPINSIAVSKDSRLAISGSADKTVKLWDLSKRRAPRTLDGHTDEVTSVVFSPDGKLALSGSADKMAIVWDVATGKRLQTLRGHVDKVKSVAFSPDARLVVSGSEDRTFKIWDVATGTLLRSIQASARIGGVESVAFSSDGKHVLSQVGLLLQIWDPATGDKVRDFETAESKFLPRARLSAAFSPDGRWVASSNMDETAHIWETATGKLLRSLKGEHQFGVTVSFSSDGRRVLWGSAYGEFRLWDATTGRLVRTSRERSSWLASFAFAPDGRRAIWASDETLKVFDTAKGETLHTISTISAKVGATAISPDGQLLILSEDARLYVWHTPTDEAQRTLHRWEGAFGSGREGPPVEHSGPIASLAFSRDGRHIVSGSRDRTIKLWHTETGNLLQTFQGHSDTVVTLAFSPNGRHFISGGFDKTIKVWEVATSKLLHSIEGHSGAVASVSFSPDGRLMLSGSYDKEVKLWDGLTGKLVHTFVGHSHPVTSIAFSPDGRQIVSADLSGVIRFWDVGTSQLLLTLFGSAKGEWLALTPSGFFDASDDGFHLLGMVRKLDVITPDQVFGRLYRPDLVQQLLKMDPEGRYKEAARKLNLEAILDSGPAPQIELVESRFEQAGDTARISIRLTGRGGGVGDEIDWRVNGPPQGDRKRPELASLASPLASVVVTETLKLIPGQVNTVEVIAYNRAGLIATPPLKISIDNLGATTTVRPRMFVLAVGVDKYRMTKYRLSYAVSDARSFAKAMAVVGTGLFSDVRTKVLTNEDVSESGIAAAIEDIARAARPQDVFVLFLGGHGASREGRYYYFPQSLDFEARQTAEEHGIGQDKWDAWFRRLGVQKTLMIIDTCESAAFVGTRGADLDSARQTAMAQLQNATGHNIIAAARDAAYEGYEGHGILTYAILEALDKKSGAGSGDQVRIATLAEHVVVRVPEISQKSFGIYQNPTRNLSGNDFPIGIRQSVLEATTAGPEIPKEPTHVLIREEVLRERPAADAAGSRTLAPGTHLRAVKFDGAWVMVARDGQKLGYVPAQALARIQ